MFCARVQPGEEFVLSFVHSVNRRPVYDTLRVEADHLVIVRSRFDSFGAGMPEASTPEGTLTIAEDGWLEWTVNRPVPEITIRVGWVANHTLHIKDREIRLADLAEPGEAFNHARPQNSNVRPLQRQVHPMSENEKDPVQSGVLTTKMEGVEAVSKEEIEKILKQVDKEAAARKLTGLPHWIVYVIGFSWSIFQVYTAAFGLLPAQLQRSIHLAYAFTLTYLLFPARAGNEDNRLHWYNWALAIFACYIGLYMALNYMRIMEAGGDYSQMDYFAAGCGILLTLEASRRVVGLPIVCLAAFFLIFSYFGAYFPGFMSHRGYSLERIASHMFLTTEGILGIPLGVAATFIYLFILFGSFREKSGLGQLFIDISNAVAGWASGGPAKMAVITSALEGMVSGSSVANTVESGSLTIPMMKRLGYRPEFAAAVEASSSTGGQIMPPIMGAAAFIMAEFLNVPYLDIAKAAAIPACLYFFGVFMEVHFEAKRCNLRGLSRDELPRFADVMKERGHLFVPLFAIIIFLSIGFTPLYAALMGLVTCIIAGALKKATRMSPRHRPWVRARRPQRRRCRLACASAGIIIGAITLTGLGL